MMHPKIQRLLELLRAQQAQDGMVYRAMYRTTEVKPLQVCFFSMYGP